MILEGELATNTALTRTQDLEDVFAKFPGIKIVRKEVANFQRIPAENVTTNLIASGVKFDALAANNDEMAIGAILALKQVGVDPSKIVIGGIDATPAALQEIEKGDLSTTVFHNASAQGVASVETAIKLMNGQDVPAYNWIPFELVNKSNFKNYLNR